jgi:hypothetical protein
LYRRLEDIQNHEAERGVGLRRAGDPPALDRSIWAVIVLRQSPPRETTEPARGSRAVPGGSSSRTPSGNIPHAFDTIDLCGAAFTSGLRRSMCSELTSDENVPNSLGGQRNGG